MAAWGLVAGRGESTRICTEAVTPSVRWELNDCMFQEYCKA